MQYFVNRRGLSISLLLVFLLSACENVNRSKPYPFTYTDGIMGTQFTIKISQLPPAIESKPLQQEIKALLDKINGQMSTYLPDSDLSRLNQSRSPDWQAVPAELYSVLKASELIHQQSQEAFDISVGKLVNLWGFGADPMTFKAPDSAVIQQALLSTGARFLKLTEPNLVKKNKLDLSLDLSAIAKGYAVDKVAELLGAKEIKHYMVEIGGEIRLKGHNIEGKAWRIAIEKPSPQQRMIQKVLPISDIAMATSGDYRNYFEQDGVRYSHTLDPRTGMPINHRLASVTVLNKSCMNADAWATALSVLGEDKGLILAEKRQLAAYFIVKTDAGFAELSTTAFKRFIGESS